MLKSRLVEEAAIPPLPSHLLPLPECKGKGGTATKKKRKTRKEKQAEEAAAAEEEKEEEEEEETEGRSQQKQQPVPRNSGLEQTVSEMLQNYQPASQEKRPFYCRICRYQGRNLDDLSTHKRTDLHRLAEEKERKVSFCRLCRKQFTSPEQLKGHLKGKPHQDLLKKRMEGGGGGRGRGGGTQYV